MKGIHILLITLSLISCTPSVTQTSSIAISSTPGSLPSLASVSPTFLPTMPSTPTSQHMATSAANFEIHPHCPQINLDAKTIPALPGTMVLSGDDFLIDDLHLSPDADHNSLLMFWEPHSDEKISYQFPESQEYYYYVTSPDKEKLAFTEGKTLAMSSDVMVLNHNGEENGKFTLPDDWNLFDWLNDEVLLVRQNRLQQDKSELIAVNPVTGEQQILPANFPNLYSRETLVVWGALTIFDPTASLVLYPQREENKLVSILWDVDNNKEIARIVGDYQPRWSPDGKQLLIVANYQSTPTDFDNYEIFLVSPDGNETRATFFKDNFERNSIGLPVWSPNSRYVAFWLSTSMSNKLGSLAVLDTETSMVDLYCNEFAPFPFRFGDHNTLGYVYDQVNSATPIWSPDSQYLLVENYQQFTSSTYLFDLGNHTITKIADNARPVSWMK